MALSPPITPVLGGAGSQHRESVNEALKILDGRVPPYDPVADSGKVLKIVGNPGVPTWAADAT